MAAASARSATDRRCQEAPGKVADLAARGRHDWFVSFFISEEIQNRYLLLLMSLY